MSASPCASEARQTSRRLQTYALRMSRALGAAVVGNTVDERAVFDLAVELSLLTDWCRSASPAQFKDTVGRPLWPRVAYLWPIVE